MPLSLRRALVRLVGACLVACATFPLAARAQEYLLGPQDKLAIRVVEWQAVESAFRDWSSVSGEYSVGQSGTISLPFVGELPASGRTTADIAKAIGDTLQNKFGLPDRPEASVELAQYRPFYISGDVQTAGQYPYAPGLTVLKALSIAGGLRRGADGVQRAARDIVTAGSNVELLRDKEVRLLVTAARIEAELAGATTITLPNDMPQSPNLEQIVANETAIMAARQKRVSLRSQALDDLKDLLEREIVSLGKKAETQRRQVELGRKELSGIDALVQKGLVVNARLLSSERSIADMEGKLLDLDTAVLRAKQDISKANQDAIDLINNNIAELTAERRQVQADLKETALKLEMHRGLMSEAIGVSPASATSAGSEVTVSYLIVRDRDGTPSEIAVDENAPVLPGDVVKVRLVGFPGQ